MQSIKQTKNKYKQTKTNTNSNIKQSTQSSFLIRSVNQAFDQVCRELNSKSSGFLTRFLTRFVAPEKKQCTVRKGPKVHCTVLPGQKCNVLGRRNRQNNNALNLKCTDFQPNVWSGCWLDFTRVFGQVFRNRKDSFTLLLGRSNTVYSPTRTEKDLHRRQLKNIHKFWADTFFEPKRLLILLNR